MIVFAAGWLLLAGCGLKDDLYLPDSGQTPEQDAPIEEEAEEPALP